jgi:hypothetical protein
MEEEGGLRVRALASSAIVFATMQILQPPEMQGQRLPASAQFAPAAVEIPPLEGGGGHWIPLAPRDPTLARPAYELPADTAFRALRRRMRPYAIGGAIVGGVVGYAVMPKSCDVGDNMFCRYQSWAYPVIAAGVGAWAGFLVGYVREGG